MTAELGYAAAILLAAVLGWAGAVKLRAPRETAAAFHGLGLPAPRALATAVPLTELAVAVALVVRPAAGAVAAVVLLGAFTVLLGVHLRRGQPVSCGCFGSTTTRPVSSVELVRNGLLLAAALAAAAGRPAAPTLAALVTVTAAGAAALVVLGLVALRRDAGFVWKALPALKERSGRALG